MTDEVVVAAAPVAAVADAAPVTAEGSALAAAVEAAPAAVVVPVATTDTDKLKALLITLGHDIEAEWDHLIALAKKVI